MKTWYGFLKMNFHLIKDFLLLSGWESGFRFSTNLQDILLDSVLKQKLEDKFLYKDSSAESLQEESTVEILLAPFLSYAKDALHKQTVLQEAPSLALRVHNFRETTLENCLRELNLESIKYENTEKQQNKKWRLLDLENKENYKIKFQNILEDIRNGRYYQINLLRFFEAKLEGDSGNAEVNVESLIRKFFKLKPKMGFILKKGDLCIASFSPERFLSIHKSKMNNAFEVASYPIKGTKPAGEESNKDWEPSIKDHAELNIIIDLVRNDLNGIANAGSVQVESEGYYLRTETVKHRVATIKAELDLSRCKNLEDILKQVLPSASITGAPKIEVLKAIAEYEKFERGYFMGNLWILDPMRQRIDSNIMIRTLHGNLKDNKFFYAAGSGITISSICEDEYTEIDLKCKVLTI